MGAHRRQGRSSGEEEEVDAVAELLLGVVTEDDTAVARHSVGEEEHGEACCSSSRCSSVARKSADGVAVHGRRRRHGVGSSRWMARWWRLDAAASW